MQQGIYTTISANEYHADPAPVASLSNSIAKLIVHRSPLHAWHAHPRLNPNGVEEQAPSRPKEIGSVAHAMILGKGSLVDVIEGAAWTKKVAQEDRAAAYAAGRLPILEADHNVAVALVARFHEGLAPYPEFASIFEADAGISEAVVVWQEGRTWCRCMLDRVSHDLRTIVDVKTTANAHPATASRRVFDNHYEMQEPFYVRGLDAIDPEGRGRRQFLFAFQETDPPHCVVPIQLDGHARSMGERQVEAAIAQWGRCMASDKWPAYAPGIHRAEMPPWMENALLAREEAEERWQPGQNPDPSLVMAG